MNFVISLKGVRVIGLYRIYVDVHMLKYDETEISYHRTYLVI